MTVTAIQELTKKKSRILFDSGESIVLYKGEISKYRIICDEEISPSSYDEIINNVLPKRAKLRAMHLLKSRPYTEKRLRDKLVENGYPSSAINTAIEYVSSFGYIDDVKYAEDYFDTYRTRKSQKRIISDLLGKGVSKDIISEVISSGSYEDNRDYEGEQIKRFLSKKGIIADDLSYEDRQKIRASLYRKGYDPALIERFI